MRNTHDAGFSLIELLIAVSLTLTVLAGTFSMLQEAGRASRLASTTSDANQNLRIAMNAVLRDLIQAGEGDFGLRTGISIPTGAGVDPIVRPSPAGFTWSFPEHYTVLPAVSPGNGIGVVVNGIATDVITILYQDRRLDFSGVIPNIPASGASMTFPVAFPIDDEAVGIKDGDLIRFGNGAMQEVSNVAGNTVHFSDAMTSGLNQRTAPDGSVMELRNGEPNFPDLPVSRVTMVTYYLKFGPGGMPQLVRRANYGAERIIAIGVENLQLTFDLVDGATNPTNVDTFDADTAEGQIRKVNLYMAGRSREVDVSSGFPLRTSLSTQVSLRSLAFVSRYDITP